MPGENKVKGMYIIRENEDRERAYVKSEEMRVSETDEGSILEGYAAVFNSYSQDLGGFREKINPGAFAKTLNDGADVRALFNHDSNLILGRTKSKTLELSEDDKGLYYRVKLPDTSYARDLVVSLKRKDITQNSFGFRVVSDTWSTDGKKRALNEVKLFDVSPVTYPAYLQTSLKLRDDFNKMGIDFDRLHLVLKRSEHGITLLSSDYDILNTTIEILTRYLPDEEPIENHSIEEPVKEDHSEEEEPSNLLTLIRMREMNQKIESLI